MQGVRLYSAVRRHLLCWPAGNSVHHPNAGSNMGIVLETRCVYREIQGLAAMEIGSSQSWLLLLHACELTSLFT